MNLKDIIVDVETETIKIGKVIGSFPTKVRKLDAQLWAEVLSHIVNLEARIKKLEANK